MIRRLFIFSLLAIYGFVCGFSSYAQTTYMQGNINFQARANGYAWANKFHQLNTSSPSSPKGIYLYDRASIHIQGDSVTALSVWRQEPNTTTHFYPPLNASEGTHRLAFLTAENAIFRNVSFDNLSSTSPSLLLRDYKNHTVRFGNRFMMPGCPVYLGSLERSNVEDYILDTGKYFILRAPDSIEFQNLNARSYLITSSASAVELKSVPSKELKFPVGYDANTFTPIEIRNPSAADYFKVTSSPWLYAWNSRFIAAGDTVNKMNIRKNGINLMWKISAENDATTGDVIAQFPDKPSLFQPFYDKNSSMLIRYVGVPNNALGQGAMQSFTYWDNSTAKMNFSNYSVFPSVLASTTTQALFRSQVKDFSKYTIFSAASWINEDVYPFAAKLNAVDFDTSFIDTDASGEKKLVWNIKSAPKRTTGFTIYFSSAPFTSATIPEFLQTISAGPTDIVYEYLFSSRTLLGKSVGLLYYKIVPQPTDNGDTNLYNYIPYFKNPQSGLAGSARLGMLGNPYSLSQTSTITAVIKSNDENILIEKLTLKIFSPTSVRKELMQKTIYKPSSSDLTVELSIPGLNLTQGQYVLTATIEYETGNTETLFNKFTIF